MKKIIYSTFMICAVSLFSCEVQDGTDELTLNPSIEAEAYKDTDTHSEVCSATERSYCDDDLTNDGCVFTSGEAKLDSYMLDDFELLLNNCKTETLPANCTWLTSNTTNKVWNIPLTHCCYSFSAYNLRLDYILDWAENRPASNDVIIGYETSFYTTGVQPYMKVKVIYRKKRCSLIHVDPIRK